MKGDLYKKGELVGEVVVFNDNSCVYHIFSEMSFTHNTTLDKLKKKYKIKMRLEITEEQKKAKDAYNKFYSSIGEDWEL